MCFWFYWGLVWGFLGLFARGRRRRPIENCAARSSLSVKAPVVLDGSAGRGIRLVGSCLGLFVSYKLLNSGFSKRNRLN